MVKSVKDRVRKYRATKAATLQGMEEIRATNRMYSARRRRKLQLKRLQQEKANVGKALCHTRTQEVEAKALSYKALQMQKKMDSKRANLTEDEQREVDIAVLKYELREMKTNKAKIGKREHLHQVAPQVVTSDADMEAVMPMTDGELVQVSTLLTGLFGHVEAVDPSVLAGIFDHEEANDSGLPADLFDNEEALL
ncbi:hypothetical protein ACHAWF_007035 [Thalassiosira exigua]